MNLDRRDFVGIAASSILGAACASLVTTPVTPEAGKIRLVIRNYPSLDQEGGTLKIRPNGSNATLYVLAMEDGSYSVVSPICKHQGCTVGIEGLRLVCPCHGSTYGRDGSVLRGPTQAPLDRFVVEARDGLLIIDYPS
jgi:cytochrome b6-f complex iron-sulfur subunit